MLKVERMDSACRRDPVLETTGVATLDDVHRTSGPSPGEASAATWCRLLSRVVQGDENYSSCVTFHAPSSCCRPGPVQQALYRFAPGQLLSRWQCRRRRWKT